MWYWLLKKVISKDTQCIAYKRHFGMSDHGQPGVSKYNILAMTYYAVFMSWSVVIEKEQYFRTLLEDLNKHIHRINRREKIAI